LLEIQLQGVGKKFERDWIFRGIDLTIESAKKIAFVGSNGSGKSTLLQLISGFVGASEGRVEYKLQGDLLDSEEWYLHITCATPYLELPEEYSLRENYHFFRQFKRFQHNISLEEFSVIANLEHAIDKPIRFFSSGMKQRMKLSLAILAESKLLLLDEPTSNLDDDGIAWYKMMMEKYITNKTTIVFSNNHSDEIYFCESKIDISTFKKKIDE
jgi:ABC-2 type transport system ATP-binding protein